MVWREKTPENKGGLPVLLIWKFIAPIPTMGKKEKNHRKGLL